MPGDTRFLIVLVVLLLSCGATSAAKKLNIGYFLELWKYDTKGANYPLPPNITDPLELLEEELHHIIPLYDVVIQAFIDPSNFHDGVIVEPQYVHDTREGVQGKPGLKELCKRHNVTLMISIGGGGAAAFVSNNPEPIVNALLQYVKEKGYAGVDIDEENTIDVDTYVNFLTVLGKTFKPAGLNVSCTIGPLSCCFQSRGICKAAPYIDWAFLMLYNGLYQDAAFDLPSGVTGSLWQDDDGQKYCGLKPVDSMDHGIVSFVASAACQFVNFALYLKWPAEKLVMGMPTYAYQSVISWFQIMEKGYTKVSSDPTTLLTTYQSPSAEQDQIIAPDDLTQRCLNVLSPSHSVLGVTLDNSGWESKILQCKPGGNYSGSTLLGIGFWQIGYEDYLHHEISQAARACINKVNQEIENH